MDNQYPNKPFSLIRYFNPPQSPRIEEAMFGMARENSAITLIGLVVVALVVGLAFHNKVEYANLMVWESMMAVTVLLALVTHGVLHQSPGGQAPSPARLLAWRRAQLVSFFVEGLAWGCISLLFEPGRGAAQNTLFLLIYLSVISAGGRASGAHSFRLFLLAEACSMPIVLYNLSNGFGDSALPLGFLIVLYAAFVSKVSYSSYRTIIRSIELQLQNERLLEENARALQMAERERIFRDLHDDLGAKLLGLAIAAQRANRPDEADLARSALQDLRDVVSRSAEETTPLADLLADWRVEAQQRLLAAGLNMDWKFPEQEADGLVSPEIALALSRILREAVSNVLRHARATRASVVIFLDEHHFGFHVEDDGIGIPIQHTRKSRGMSGMMSRAAALGATLHWQRVEPCGCRVAFSIPRARLTP